jgi:hypothetical protein
MKKFGTLSLLAGSVALLSSCSTTAEEPGRDSINYTIPPSLCGTEISQDLYSAVLPQGDSIDVEDRSRERSDGYTSPVGNCFLHVDGSTALTLHSIPSEDGIGLAGYHDALTRGIEESEEIETDDGWEARVWPNFVAVHVNCTGSERNYTGINLSIRLDWLTGEQDYSEPLADLIIPYTEKRIADLPPDSCAVDEKAVP